MVEVERTAAFYDAAARLGVPRGFWLDELLSDFEATIRADPEAYREIAGTGLRAGLVRGIAPVLPPCLVTYSYDGRTCRLLAIRRALEPNP